METRITSFKVLGYRWAVSNSRDGITKAIAPPKLKIIISGNKPTFSCSWVLRTKTIDRASMAPDTTPLTNPHAALSL